jgi:hypothetical protein
VCEKEMSEKAEARVGKRKMEKAAEIRRGA